MLTLFSLIGGAFWLGMVLADVVCRDLHGQSYPLTSILLSGGLGMALLSLGLWRYATRRPQDLREDQRR